MDILINSRQKIRAEEENKLLMSILHVEIQKISNSYFLNNKYFSPN